MLTASRTAFCIGALFAFVMSGLFLVQHWVYPAVISKPFGQDLFAGAALAILAAMTAVVYLALRVIVK